jgi:hypothetical protein
MSVTGNANVGNLGTSGLIIATGNVTGGNISTTGQITSTQAGNLSDGGGQIYLNGSGNNRIDFNTNGTGAPAFTTRSAGTKVVLFPSIGASAADYAIGVDSGTLWSGIPGADGGQFFRWYGGTTEVANLSGTGMLAVTGNITGGNISTAGTATVATVTVSTLANITATTAATSNITGALTVAGGVGIGGKLYAGDMYSNDDLVLTDQSTIDGGLY